MVELHDNSQIFGTIAIRKLKDSVFADTNNCNSVAICELKRMFLAKQYRGLGIGQELLDIALDYAKKIGYSKILLYSSKDLVVSRQLYLKNGFVDIRRYNDDPRADVFMVKKL